MKRQTLQKLHPCHIKKDKQNTSTHTHKKPLIDPPKTQPRTSKQKLPQYHHSQHNHPLQLKHPEITTRTRSNNNQLFIKKQTTSQKKLPSFNNFQNNHPNDPQQHIKYYNKNVLCNNIVNQKQHYIQRKTFHHIPPPNFIYESPKQRNNHSKSLYTKQNQPVQVKNIKLKQHQQVKIKSNLPPKSHHQLPSEISPQSLTQICLPPPCPQIYLARNQSNPQNTFPKKTYPIYLKKQQINQSQIDRIRNIKYLGQNSDKIQQDGTIPIKLVLVGDGSVGKTSMLISYTTNKFPNQYLPTIFDNYVADIKLGQDLIKLWLWDTAGQQQYAQLRLISYQKADIFFICFSMIDQISFHNALGRWWNQVKEQTPNAFMIFVGTKSDLHQQYLNDPSNIHKAIPIDYIKRKCKAKKCLFMSCNGINQKGLNQVFSYAMSIVVDKVKRKNKSNQLPCQII